MFFLYKNSWARSGPELGSFEGLGHPGLRDYILNPNQTLQRVRFNSDFPKKVGLTQNL